MDNLSELEKELEKVIRSVSRAKENSSSGYDTTTEGSSLGPIRIMEGLVHALLSNNMELDKRLSAVEAKVMTMGAGLTKPGARSNAALIHENTARDRYVNLMIKWDRSQW